MVFITTPAPNDKKKDYREISRYVQALNGRLFGRLNDVKSQLCKANRALKDTKSRLREADRALEEMDVQRHQVRENAEELDVMLRRSELSFMQEIQRKNRQIEELRRENKQWRSQESSSLGFKVQTNDEISPQTQPSLLVPQHEAKENTSAVPAEIVVSSALVKSPKGKRKPRRIRGGTARRNTM